MSPIRFGEHQLCGKCKGTGRGSVDQTERARELRLAKRQGREPAAITYQPCQRCNGSGYTVVETLPKVEPGEVWPV